MPTRASLNTVTEVRVLIALGGNAMTAPDGSARPEDARPEDQLAAIGEAMRAVAAIVADGRQAVITHGKGPQVGNLLVKNELAASVVPPVPLDWCVAQTQATIGLLILDALEASLMGTPSGPPVAVTSVHRIRDALDGTAGTVVTS
jgi:carbamate kinase